MKRLVMAALLGIGLASAWFAPAVLSQSIFLGALPTNCTNTQIAISAGNNLWQCGTDSGTPGGSTTQVQFNNAGAFGGDAGFVYDAATDRATLVGGIDLLSTGVRMSAADGVLTLLGLGNGNDENLTLDLDNAAANTVAVASGTGANALTLAGFGLSYATATLSSLTAGRVPIVSTAGLIADDDGLLYNATTNIVSFISGGGLSFAGITDPITIVTGDIAYGDTALIIDNVLADYLVVSLPSYTDIVMGAGGSIDSGSDTFGFFRTATVLTVADQYGLQVLMTLDPAANATMHAVAFQGGVTNGANARNLQQVVGFDAFVNQTGSGSVAALYANRATAYHNGAGTVTAAVGQYGVVRNVVGGTMTSAYGNYTELENLGVGTISVGYTYYAKNPVNSGGGTFSNYYAFYSQDITAGTNPYAFWYDGGVGTDCNDGGVFRVNDFGILAYYNPCFAKYTAGAANFERIIARWGDTGVFGTDNRSYLGTEEGGTGVERPLSVNAGNVSFTSLTLSPAVSNTSANSCGTSAATIAGNDNVWKITVGATSGTSCTVTFATPFIAAPSCIVTNETTANLLRATSTTTTSVVAGVLVAGDVLAGLCVGREDS